MGGEQRTIPSSYIGSGGTESFIDIHTHILPGVDDGSKDMDESMEMLKIAYGEGTRRIILTPHFHSEQRRYETDELDAIFMGLQKQVESTFPGMELYLGNEIMYSFDTLRDLREGRIHTINGTRYVLVEYLPEVSLQAIKQSISDLQRAGWLPVIAHVERYMCLAGKMDEMADIRAMGAYLQMNTNSLVKKGWFDKRVKWCRKLVINGDISFLGTDAHGTKQRTPECTVALGWLNETLNRQARNRILYENAERMLRGDIL